MFSVDLCANLGRRLAGSRANKGAEGGLAAETKLFGNGAKRGGGSSEEFHGIFQADLLKLFVEGHAVAFFRMRLR